VSQRRVALRIIFAEIAARGVDPTVPTASHRGEATVPPTQPKSGSRPAPKPVGRVANSTIDGNLRPTRPVPVLGKSPSPKSGSTVTSTDFYDASSGKAFTNDSG